MSTKGIYTALSGAMAQNERLETISNNIANVNTTGFKKDQQIFKEYLTAYEKDPTVITVPRVEANIESFYDLAAGDRGYVDAQATFTDFAQGSMKPTGNNLDIGIEGKGFLEVLTPQGVRMTRDGALKLDGQGRLVSKDGLPILSEGFGQDPNSRIIRVNTAGGSLSIGEDGSIFQGTENLGKLSLVTLDNLSAAHKVGHGLYTTKPNMNAQTIPANNIKLHQGFLENSNVNIVKEMTDLIQTTRTFESTQKAIKTYDEMAEKLVNTIPALR